MKRKPSRVNNLKSQINFKFFKNKLINKFKSNLV